MCPTIRSKPRAHCLRCLVRPDLCICDRIPTISVATGICVLMHIGESKLTTNTARIAHFSLTNSEIIYRGVMGAAAQPSFSHLTNAAQEGRVHLLYPDDDAKELTPEFVATLPRPITLVVPDGNWRQAGKATHRDPFLMQLPRVKLPPGLPSEYRLRTASKPHMLCTMEAIARALEILEGKEVYDTLMQIFRLKVARTLWSRGILQREAKGRGEVPVYPA